MLGITRIIGCFLALILLPLLAVTAFAANVGVGDKPVPRLKPGAVIESPSDGVPIPRLKPKRRQFVIVIDAGHGGHDPGAIGKGKTKEEDITLKAALELKKQLLAKKRYKIVLTRSADQYIAHDDRVRIARKAGADLFISLHADSASNSSARGASVYTLASRAENRSDRLVSHQKWIANVDLAQTSQPVSNILVDLAQRKTRSQSAQFADILLSELGKKSKLIGNSHRQAGYYVLLAPDVPAVLLEMGFVSNRKDEKLLASSKHRKKLMQAVTTAIDKFFMSKG